LLLPGDVSCAGIQVLINQSYQAIASSQVVEKSRAGDVWRGLCPRRQNIKSAKADLTKGGIKMKRNLKNAMFIGFVLMICALFASTAMAENEYGLIDPPENFVEVEDPVPGEVCFSWTAVERRPSTVIVIEVMSETKFMSSTSAQMTTGSRKLEDDK
jgi:hypothetical protein